MAGQLDAVDFAVAAFAVEGEWTVQEVTIDHLADVGTLLRALRRLPGGDAIAMLALDEDWFLVARVTGDRSRVLLSDVTAATEWELAASALDELGLPEPEDDDEQVPAGHLDLLADLGIDAEELGAQLDDLDLYPDEVLSEIAHRVGFGELFDDAVDAASV